MCLLLNTDRMQYCRNTTSSGEIKILDARMGPWCSSAMRGIRTVNNSCFSTSPRHKAAAGSFQVIKGSLAIALAIFMTILPRRDLVLVGPLYCLGYPLLCACGAHSRCCVSKLRLFMSDRCCTEPKYSQAGPILECSLKSGNREIGRLFGEVCWRCAYPSHALVNSGAPTFTNDNSRGQSGNVAAMLRS